MVDQVDDVVTAASGALSDAGAGDGDGEMGLSGAGSADEHDVALAFQEAAGGELLVQRLVDGRGGEVEVGQLLGLGSLALFIWYLIERAFLSAILGLEQRADDLLYRMTALEPVGEDRRRRRSACPRASAGPSSPAAMTLHDRAPLRLS